MSAASRSMARRPDDLARNFGSGPSANDNHPGLGASSALPPDARAVIEPVPRATKRDQSGRARRAWTMAGAVRAALAARCRSPDRMDRRRRSARDDRAAFFRRRDRSELLPALGIGLLAPWRAGSPAFASQSPASGTDAGGVLLANRSARTVLRPLSGRA